MKEVRDGPRAHLAGAFLTEGTERADALDGGVPGVLGEGKGGSVCGVE